MIGLTWSDLHQSLTGQDLLSCDNMHILWQRPAGLYGKHLFAADVHCNTAHTQPTCILLQKQPHYPKGRCFSIYTGFDSISQSSWWAGGWMLSYWAPNNLPTPSGKYICYCQPYHQHLYLQLNTFSVHIISKLCTHTTISTSFPKIPPYAPHGEVSCETVNQTFGQPATEATNICAPLSVLHAE